ncbi:MAG: hypothetical protein KDA75_21490 [Planctomycetaceae bacterium]|nr:hypothetical protein [Planctomycetaceae bacterium]
MSAIAIEALCVVVLVGSTPFLVADDSREAESHRRMEYMQDLISQFEVTVSDAPDEVVTFTTTPLLRYSNPVQNSYSDGCVWLWTQDSVPLAATSLSIRGNRKVGIEFTSLSVKPLSVNRQGAATWSPASSGLMHVELDGAPEVHGAAPVRLAQMRKLASEFTVQKVSDPANPTVLRLLTQPIHRYSCPTNGIVDGALFSFSEATDPEALLVLEACEPTPPVPANRTWRYSLVRMSSQPLVMFLRDKEVFHVEKYWGNPRTRHDPYIEEILETYTDNDPRLQDPPIK